MTVSRLVSCDAIGSAPTAARLMIAMLAGTVIFLVPASTVDGSDGETTSGSTVDVADCAVHFAAEVKIPAMESGRVAQVFVQTNAAVAAGTELARLDDRTLVIQRRAAVLRLNSARTEAIDDVERRYAETALAEAQAELDMNRSIQNDVRGAVPLTQMRRLRLAVERAELEVALATKRRQRADIEVQLREADLAVIDDQIANLRLVSPIDGIVLEFARSANEWIDKGQPIATIARIDRVHVHALVDGRMISPAVCTGLPVSVHWTDPRTGQSHSLRGKVLSVDPEMLPGHRFRLHAEIVNRMDPPSTGQWQLRPGAEVRMKVYVPTSLANRTATRFQ